LTDAWLSELLGGSVVFRGWDLEGGSDVIGGRCELVSEAAAKVCAEGPPVSPGWQESLVRSCVGGRGGMTDNSVPQNNSTSGSRTQGVMDKGL
jgi:hypothetical protein